MKTSVKVLALVLVVVMLCLTLASCGGLSGTYEGTLATYEFKGSKYTKTVGNQETTGTYKVEKDEEGAKTITFTPDGGEDAYTWVLIEGKDDQGAYIKIGLTSKVAATYYKK